MFIWRNVTDQVSAIPGACGFDGTILYPLAGEAESCLKRQVPANEMTRLINQLIEEICKKAGINEKELRMGGRRRKVSETRAEISYQLNCEWGIPAAEIARHLGLSRGR
jgi:hypothetical protein